MADHHHFLVSVGNLTAAQRTKLAAVIAADACTWFNYTTDTWIICTTSTGQAVIGKLSGAFLGTGSMPYFMVLRLDAQAAIGGMLPTDAWTWLRAHNLVGGG